MLKTDVFVWLTVNWTWLLANKQGFLKFFKRRSNQAIKIMKVSCHISFWWLFNVFNFQSINQKYFYWKLKKLPNCLGHQTDAANSSITINDSSSGTSSRQDPSSLKPSPVSEKPNQPPNSFNFPTHKFGKTTVVGRKFQSKCFILHPWLHYDETNDQVFCHTCIQAYNQGHLNSCNNIEATFMEKGYSNWKDALSNNRFQITWKF